jgi:hypothetical protein
MKFLLHIIILTFSLLVSTAYNSEDVVSPNENAQEIPNETIELMKDTIIITVGNQVFTATLETNATAAAFKAMLPLTIDMQELNSNEKFFDFSRHLPANASNPGTINSGDIMLWGSNTLVLFYKTFSTTYSYTRVGKIENPSGLAVVLGPGNAKVLFELQH